MIYAVYGGQDHEKINRSYSPDVNSATGLDHHTFVTALYVVKQQNE